MMSENLKTELERILALALAIAMVVALSTDFRDSSLKATELSSETEAVAPTPSEPQTAMAEIVIPPVVETAGEEVENKAEEAGTKEAASENDAADELGEQAENPEQDALTEDGDTSDIQSDTEAEIPEEAPAEGSEEEDQTEEPVCTCSAEEGQEHAPECPLFGAEDAKSNEETVTYTASFSITGEGKVTCDGEHQSGFEVQVKAGEELRFAVSEGASVRVNGTAVNPVSGSEYAVTMDADKSISVSFGQEGQEEEQEEEKKAGPKCSCDAAEGEAHAEGCPLYVDKEVYLDLNVVLDVINLSGGKIGMGSQVRLQAGVVNAPEGSSLNYTWYYSTDGSSWNALSVSGDHYDFTVDAANGRYYWKVDASF